MCWSVRGTPTLTPTATSALPHLRSISPPTEFGLAIILAWSSIWTLAKHNWIRHPGHPGDVEGRLQ
jgi:hypothetical protein